MSRQVYVLLNACPACDRLSAAGPDAVRYIARPPSSHMPTGDSTMVRALGKYVSLCRKRGGPICRRQVPTLQNPEGFAAVHQYMINHVLIEPPARHVDGAVCRNVRLCSPLGSSISNWPSLVRETSPSHRRSSAPFQTPLECLCSRPARAIPVGQLEAENSISSPNRDTIAVEIF